MAVHGSWADDSMVEGWALTGEHSVTMISTVDAGMALHVSWTEDSTVEVWAST